MLRKAQQHQTTHTGAASIAAVGVRAPVAGEALFLVAAGALATVHVLARLALVLESHKVRLNNLAAAARQATVLQKKGAA